MNERKRQEEHLDQYKMTKVQRSAIPSEIVWNRIYPYDVKADGHTVHTVIVMGVPFKFNEYDNDPVEIGRWLNDNMNDNDYIVLKTSVRFRNKDDAVMFRLSLNW